MRTLPSVWRVWLGEAMTDAIPPNLTEEERQRWRPHVLLAQGQGSMPMVESHLAVARDLLRTISDARSELKRARSAFDLILSWTQNRDPSVFDREAVRQLCLHWNSVKP